MALTKADMAERLFEEVGLNKREAKEFVEAFFEIVRGSLENGEQVNRPRNKPSLGGSSSPGEAGPARARKGRWLVTNCTSGTCKNGSLYGNWRFRLSEIASLV